MDERPLIDSLWILLCAGLVFLMQGGFLCLETGVTRAKNNINVAIKNLTDFAISVVLFWTVGFALAFGASWGGAMGTSRLAPSFAGLGAWDVSFFLYQAMFCGTAVTILSGAVAERMRFAAYFVAAAIVSVIVYPVFGHWAWNGLDVGEPLGWLGGRGFIDFAGSTVVHSTGGWVAVAALLVIGPRAGRFPPNGPPVRIPRSNLPVATLGVVLLWLGWIGFNGGSVLAFDPSVPLIIANTMLGGAAGLLSALLVGRVVIGRADVEMVMNGSLAGLVAVTANCFAVTPLAALAIGGIGGVVMVAVVRLLEALRIDDAIGAIPVHLGAGIWGTLAVAIFSDPAALGTGLGRWEQLGVQALGVVACGAWALAITYLLFRSIDRVFPFRVSADDERIGLNVSEHDERTDLVDLFRVMNEQADSGDLSLRAPVEPFTEVGRIAQRYNALMSSLEVTIQELTETTAAKERMESELRIGREIQMSMLPLLFPAFPDNDEFSIHATVEPAREVGGDFYDFFFIDANQLCFCIGDVSGKGVPAALFMAVCKTLIKARASDEFSSANILTCVNQELSADNDSAMFVTAFLGILDIKSGEVVYTNAGHNPPYLKRAEGEIEVLEGRHGPVAGAMTGLRYREDRASLRPGDTLLLYTDGLTEAMNPDDELYSRERLVEFLASREYQSAEDMVRSAARSVHQFARGAEQSDDVTLMSLQFLGQPLESESPDVLEVTARNQLSDISRVNDLVSAFAQRFRVPREIAHKVSLVVDEVLNNIISYAYRDDGPHEIDVRVELLGDRLTVIVSDDGIPFNPFSTDAPETESPIEERQAGGLGIHLIRNLMNNVSYKRRLDRNVVSLVKYLNGEVAG